MKRKIEAQKKELMSSSTEAKKSNKKCSDWNLSIEEHSFSACMMNTGS